MSQSSVGEAERLLSQARSLSQRVAGHTKRNYTETVSISEEVASLFDALQKAEDEACKHIGPTQHSASTVDWANVVLLLDQAKATMLSNGPGGDLRRFSKVKKPFLMTMFLGTSVDVHTTRKEDSMRIKDEYHQFRNRSAYTMFTFAFILHVGLLRAKAISDDKISFSLTPVLMVLTQLFLCWLLFFYTASALRESVLRCNGSYLRSWWIHHHYWSVATCCLMLSLPVDSPSFVRAIQMFFRWAMLQSVVIIAQNRYQRRRMYTRIALGKNNSMDIVSGETSGAEGQLLIVIPMLFGLQGLQAYIGIEMLRQTYWALLSPEGFLEMEAKELDLWGSRGVSVAGIMMIYMAIRNFATTLDTLLQKKSTKEKAAMKIAALQRKQT